MTRILFVGQIPESVDFSDPALPPGLDTQKIKNGITYAIDKINQKGWLAEVCMVAPDETAVPVLEKKLSGSIYDCVVIGAGLRLPPKSLTLFEKIINTIHKIAPKTSIAFNTHPEDTAEAAARWIKQ